jgi:hypothetical protein
LPYGITTDLKGKRKTMETNDICMLDCTLSVKKGVSKKTNKEYRMTVLVISTEEFGDLEVVLDTRNDRAGILLDTIARKEGV